MTVKKDDIQVGKIFSDGKFGLRKVLRVGVEAQETAHKSSTEEFIEYEILHARRAEPWYAEDRPNFCTRTNLAQWAKEEVPDNQVARVRAQMMARNTKVSPAGARLLGRLHEAQAGQPHAQTISGKERATALKLQEQEFLLLTPGAEMGRLSLVGEAWCQQREEKAVPAPRPRSPRRP